MPSVRKPADIQSCPQPQGWPSCTGKLEHDERASRKLCRGCTQLPDRKAAVEEGAGGLSCCAVRGQIFRHCCLCSAFLEGCLEMRVCCHMLLTRSLRSVVVAHKLLDIVRARPFTASFRRMQAICPKTEPAEDQTTPPSRAAPLTATHPPARMHAAFPAAHERQACVGGALKAVGRRGITKRAQPAATSSTSVAWSSAWCRSGAWSRGTTPRWLLWC